MVPAAQIANLVRSDDRAHDTQTADASSNRSECQWAGPGHKDLSKVYQPGETMLTLSVDVVSYASAQGTQDRAASAYDQQCAGGIQVPELGEHACKLLNDAGEPRSVSVVVRAGGALLKVAYDAVAGTDGAAIPTVREVHDNVVQIAGAIKAHL